MPYCKYCGSAVDSDAIFCTECGKRLVNPPPRQKEVPQEIPIIKTEPIHGESITKAELQSPYNTEQLQEYMQRVIQYRTSMSVMNEFYNTQGQWSEYDLQLWAEMEAVMRKKYDIPENSIYRFVQPERREPVKQQPERRRNKSYNKKDTEYWKKFEKENSE